PLDIENLLKLENLEDSQIDKLKHYQEANQKAVNFNTKLTEYKNNLVLTEYLLEGELEFKNDLEKLKETEDYQKFEQNDPILFKQFKASNEGHENDWKDWKEGDKVWNTAYVKKLCDAARDRRFVLLEKVKSSIKDQKEKESLIQ